MPPLPSHSAGPAAPGTVSPESVEPITVEQLLAIDAEYKPFPAFSEWPKALPREDLWERRLEELGELREKLAATHLSRAVKVAMRAAAFNTGAIEGPTRLIEG